MHGFVYEIVSSKHKLRCHNSHSQRSCGSGTRCWKSKFINMRVNTVITMWISPQFSCSLNGMCMVLCFFMKNLELSGRGIRIEKTIWRSQLTTKSTTDTIRIFKNYVASSHETSVVFFRLTLRQWLQFQTIGIPFLSLSKFIFSIELIDMNPI